MIFSLYLVNVVLLATLSLFSLFPFQNAMRWACSLPTLSTHHSSSQHKRNVELFSSRWSGSEVWANHTPVDLWTNLRIKSKSRRYVACFWVESNMFEPLSNVSMHRKRRPSDRTRSKKATNLNMARVSTITTFARWTWTGVSLRASTLPVAALWSWRRDRCLRNWSIPIMIWRRSVRITAFTWVKRYSV